jgi:hypothetical protein
MRTQIRNAVFETNSSSSHSVTVAADELVDHVVPKELLRGGVIRAQMADHYGWEWHRFYEPGSKIAYLVTQVAGWKAFGTAGKDITAVLRRDERVSRMLDMVERRTGCRVEIIGANSPGIDHDSVGVGIDLLGDEDEFLRFIFSPGSFIETGNDNSQPPVEIMTDLGGTEKYHAPRVVKTPDDAVRFDFTLDIYGGNFFIHPEGGEPLYAFVDDRLDVSRILQALDGMVLEKVAVWMQKPAGMDPELAREFAEDAVHGRLVQLADDIPGFRMSDALSIEPTYDDTTRPMSKWDVSDSASYTFTAVIDTVQLDRVLDVVGRHSGMAETLSNP